MLQGEADKRILTQHKFENLGQSDGKNALIFNGESVAAIRYK